ncbi:MAG: hypothetical protein AAF562_09710 [Pseudomonadota bacterium]
MPLWLQILFSITVLAALLFVVFGVIAAFKTRGKLLRPWLLIMVGVVTLVNVYLLTAPIATQMPAPAVDYGGENP